MGKNAIRKLLTRSTHPEEAASSAKDNRSASRCRQRNLKKEEKWHFCHLSSTSLARYTPDENLAVFLQNNATKGKLFKAASFSGGLPKAMSSL